MHVAAAILLVASGCSLVMSRPPSEVEVNEPFAFHGPILPSVVHIGRDVNGVWKVLSDKAHDIKVIVVQPAVNGVLESADGARGIFTDTVNGITTAVLKPIIAVANDAWDGVSNKVEEMQVAVVQPVVDGFQQSFEGATIIFQGTVHDINENLMKPAVDAAYSGATGALQTVEQAIVGVSSGIQNGIDAVHAGAINALEGFEHKVNNIHSDDAAHAEDAVEETSSDI